MILLSLNLNQLFSDNRWAGPLLWIVLHTLDYYLTLWSVALHRAGAEKSLDVGGSLELNPVMRGALEKRRPISVRFVVTLVAVAVALYVIQPFVHEEPGLWRLLLGMILFTRLSVIGHHIHNIVFLRAIRAGEVKGRMEYPRPKVLQLSALRYGAEVVTLLCAALVTGSEWLWGGALGLGALVLVMLVRLGWESLRRGRRSL